MKGGRPVGTDQKPTELGFVYSQLFRGMLVDPRLYKDPWQPTGAGSTQSAGEVVAARAAAYHTSLLVDNMLLVTRDGSYQGYQGGRKVSAAYSKILQGMQPSASPDLAPDVQKRIDEAKKVLYGADLTTKSNLYKAYEKNSRAYAKAVSDYADAQSLATANAAQAQSWPVKSQSLQLAVDQAWDTLKAEGADQVEAALNTIKSVGINVDASMIASARQTFQAFSKLGLSGVADTGSGVYAFCSPPSWPDYTADDSGWTTIEITSAAYKSHMGKQYEGFSNFTGNTSSSSTTVSGGASYFGLGATAGYHTASGHADTHSDNGSEQTVQFHNDAKNVSIKFQYGVIEINRPWLVGDLFYLRNWYLKDYKAKSISDGTIEGQVNNQDNLLPMIPMQFLVIRNLEIKAEDWGSDSATMESVFGESGGAWDSSSSGYSAGAGFSCGLFSATANVGHEQAKTGVSTYGRVNADQRADYEAVFRNNTLTIKGAQIVAFLCSIVPPCAPLDDPTIATHGSAAPATAPAQSPAQQQPAQQPSLVH